MAEPEEAAPATTGPDLDKVDDPEISAATPKACKSVEDEVAGAPVAAPSDTTKETVPADAKTMSETAHIACLATSEDMQIAEEPMELDHERKSLLKKHADMKKRCLQRSDELVELVREGLEEEQFEMPALEAADTSSDEEFPEAVVSNMARIIEGR